VTTMGLTAFISYAHADRVFFERFMAAMRPLQQEGLIRTWSDVELLPGDAWRNTLMERIDASELLILLVSPAFLASRFCTGAELRRALARHEAGLTRVVPVILMPCEWRGTSLGGLQALPRGVTALAEAEDVSSVIAEMVAAFRQLARVLAQPARASLEQELGLFGCAELMRLKAGADRAIRLIEMTMAAVPREAWPFLRVLELDDLQTRRDRYEAEFRRRCMDA
jgi:hypothetical protein